MLLPKTYWISNNNWEVFVIRSIRRNLIISDQKYTSSIIFLKKINHSVKKHRSDLCSLSNNSILLTFDNDHVVTLNITASYRSQWFADLEYHENTG